METKHRLPAALLTGVAAALFTHIASPATPIWSDWNPGDLTDVLVTTAAAAWFLLAPRVYRVKIES